MIETGGGGCDDGSDSTKYKFFSSLKFQNIEFHSTWSPIFQSRYRTVLRASALIHSLASPRYLILHPTLVTDIKK